jgi:chromosome partitioning protein
MIKIALVSQKGGAGKTTLAVHLGAFAAASGYGACIVDIDPQASAAAWGDWRKGEDPDVITAHPPRLLKTLDDAASAGVEVAIIDTPPHADSAAREAVKVADLVLIPCRPRMFDLHAIQATADLVNFAGKKAFVVFNAAPPNATRLFAEVSKVIEGFGLKAAPVVISDRAAYHHSVPAGRTASEIEPVSRAAAEIEALWNWACNHVNMPSCRHNRTNQRNAA